MMDFWIGAVAGLFAGATVGMLLTCIMIAGGRKCPGPGGAA